MHIPDGYLSPSTCACLYGGCAPFWYASFTRVRTTLQSRTIPLLSLFAAFSFVLMMFNLPPQQQTVPPPPDKLIASIDYQIRSLIHKAGNTSEVVELIDALLDKRSDLMRHQLT